LAADGLDGIPDELRANMENVAVMVDNTRPPGRLFGPYEGVPPYLQSGSVGQVASVPVSGNIVLTLSRQASNWAEGWLNVLDIDEDDVGPRAHPTRQSSCQYFSGSSTCPRARSE
jgi:hypothetical protein